MKQRSIKQSSLFDLVNATHQTTTMKGLNTNGTCGALNSVVQVLYATTPLRKWCRNNHNRTGSDSIADTLDGIFRDMNPENTGVIIANTGSLKSVVTKYAGVDFDDFEDPARLLNCILNGLMDQAGDKESSNVARMWTLEKNSIMKCVGCKWSTASRMKDITLHVCVEDDDPKVLVQEQVGDFIYLINDYTCNKCKTNTDLHVTETFMNTPRILAVTINRVVRADNTTVEPSKIVTGVQFDEQLIFNKQAYELYAVITHIGHVNRGHIRAYVKHDKCWFCADDTRVVKCEWSDVMRTQGAYCSVGEVAYVLLYKRC